MGWEGLEGGVLVATWWLQRISMNCVASKIKGKSVFSLFEATVVEQHNKGPVSVCIIQV